MFFYISEFFYVLVKKEWLWEKIWPKNKRVQLFMKCIRQLWVTKRQRRFWHTEAGHNVLYTVGVTPYLFTYYKALCRDLHNFEQSAVLCSMSNIENDILREPNQADILDEFKAFSGMPNYLKVSTVFNVFPPANLSSLCWFPALVPEFWKFSPLF